MAQYSTSLLVVTALLCAGCNSDSGAGDASPNTPTDPPTVLPTLRVADATGPEGDVGDTTLRFEVTLSAPSADPVSVDYESANDTALAGPDYVSVAGTLVIPPGATAGTISVTVHGDTVDEQDESFLMMLSAPTNATLAQTSARGTITDDDEAAALPILSVADAIGSEGDAGVTTLRFDVSLSAASADAVSIDYESADESALAGSDYDSVNGTLIIPPGITNGTISVTVHGDTIDEQDESFLVTLSAPLNATILRTSVRGTIVDDDGAPPPVLSVADAIGTEGDAGDTILRFEVTLSTASAETVSIDYESADDTALAGSDYAAVDGTLTIPAGATSGVISVAVHGDTADEQDESFLLRLSAPVNATTAQISATGTIIDDDDAAALPALTVADAAVPEGDAGTTTIAFDVTLSTASADTVSIDYETVDDTAIAGSDYDSVSGTLIIPPGVTTSAIEVSVQGDTADEQDEFFTLLLSAPVNATVAQASARGTISDDDDPVPALTVADAIGAEGDTGDTTLEFTVTLSESSTNTVTLDYATADDTAASESDYASTSGTLSIVPGATSASISVTVHGDTLDEQDESFLLILSDPTNATLAQASARGTIIDDDDPAGPVFGLDTRPDNQTCIAPPRPNVDSDISVVEAFAGLPDINQPTKMLLEPVADPRWFVLRKTGQLVTFDPDNATSLTTYLDLSGVVRTSSEGGLLGMAFHPNYPATPEIFLSYTIDHNNPDMRSVISRFILDDVTDPGPGVVEEVILRVDQDYDNHNGGDIAFGPDGYLYIGLGDGGSANDPLNRAQDTTRLLGSMLRIDVLNASPYGIPTDNPFSGNALCGPGGNADDCPEIYAWGLRNPWRWSFDPDTGQLWAGDVGQNAIEEVDLIERGGNYGWRCREGTRDNITAACVDGLLDPVTEYTHSIGWSITGGMVYRGSAIPELVGRYVFSDYGSGRFWALVPDGNGGYTNDELVDTNFGPTSFGVDQDGELYITDMDNSRLRKIVPAGTSTPDTIPLLLSATGCTDPNDVTEPYAGLVPYDLNAPFWSDGALKDRHIGLPNGTTIARNGDGDWEFPNGAVIVKNFRINGDLIETRHLMRHPDGVWAGYTYEWNSQQTEATRVKGGKTVSIAGQDWTFPSEGQCMECHTTVADFALGPETAQLNGDFTYPSTQRTANQLETLDHIMMFSSPLPGPASGLADMPDPADTGADLTARARAYLHTNCAQCHRPGGPVPSAMDLRYTTSLQDTNACDVFPQAGRLGNPNARLIHPGSAANSMVIIRTSRRDVHGMPPLGSNVVDAAGVALLSDWIDNLSSCN